MNWDLLAVGVGVLAAIPGLLFFVNRLVYRAPSHGRRSPRGRTPISVLIPARNEARNLPATLEAVLANRDVDLEVIVLDDHSTDGTADVVRCLQRLDPRLRLEFAPPLPPGWCGKQHACHVLAQRAIHPWLAFIDADVRLAPDGLMRLAEQAQANGVDLLSGVPRQETGSLSEKLLLPLIHFILLGFLPMHAMRRSRSERFAAGCGQLMFARRAAYEACGGHARILTSLHDGLQLPRVFRRAGFRTDLCDATRIASCRMYTTDGEVWRGLAKNATEGLADRKVILPMTLLLLGGQVLPWLLLGLGWDAFGGVGRSALAMAAALTVLPRLAGVIWFRQPCVSALLHPIGILALLAIQWVALIRSWLGYPASWKGRSYVPVEGSSVARRWVRTGTALSLAALLSLLSTPRSRGADLSPAGLPRLGSVCLEDQFQTSHSLVFPTSHLTILTCADREGAAQINDWVREVKSGGFDTNRVVIQGVADVRKVPGFLRGMVRRRFAERYAHPVLMDWKGQVTTAVAIKPGVANVFLVDSTGRVVAQHAGPPTAGIAQEFRRSIQSLLEPPR